MLLLSWRHSGFNVHSLVRTETKAEAERVGKYMIRSVPFSGLRAGPERIPTQLTTPERSFILIPEGEIGFQNETGFVIAAGRKRKFLTLRRGH